MVITIEIANFVVKKVSKAKICLYHEQLINFSGECVDTCRYIDLLTTFDDPSVLRTISVCYLVIEAEMSYNVLINYSILNTLGTIVSTPHLIIKFPFSNVQVVTVKEDQKMARQCYVDNLKVVTR
ncbi:hypothetical protein CR513_14908, partial [Mucuna pruriens]